MPPKLKILRQRKHQRTNRGGAILLDLFIATLIFATCVVAIGQLGSQSLQIASTNATERLAVIKAESAMAKELAKRPATGSPRIWTEAIAGMPFAVRATWNETEQTALYRVTIEVARSSDFERSIVTLTRCVYAEGS